jgi:hypothetical protein
VNSSVYLTSDIWLITTSTLMLLIFNSTLTRLIAL